ncbi:MAG: hypothetical protein MUP19_10130, partial [Candidatus Aminicenantes bacterium]|nr:hypothetical protein [Candidatus Aminicenantes bacterium]
PIGRRQGSGLAHHSRPHLVKKREHPLLPTFHDFSEARQPAGNHSEIIVFMPARGRSKKI